jgi:hypothetical protein
MLQRLTWIAGIGAGVISLMWAREQIAAMLWP